MDDEGGSLLWGKQRNSCNVKMFFKVDVMEIGFVGGVAIQPCEWGCISVEAPFFQKPYFLLQNCFHGTFPSCCAFLPPQPSRQCQFFTGFYQHSHSGGKHNRNYLQGGSFYFCFMPEDRSGKMLKNELSSMLTIFSSQKYFGLSDSVPVWGEYSHWQSGELLIFLYQCLSFQKWCYVWLCPVYRNGLMGTMQDLWDIWEILMKEGNSSELTEEAQNLDNSIIWKNQIPELYPVGALQAQSGKIIDYGSIWHVL